MTTVQTCLMHLMSNSLDYADWMDHKLAAAMLKPIYAAAPGSGLSDKSLCPCFIEDSQKQHTLLFCWKP